MSTCFNIILSLPGPLLHVMYNVVYPYSLLTLRLSYNTQVEFASTLNLNLIDIIRTWKVLKLLKACTYITLITAQTREEYYCYTKYSLVHCKLALHCTCTMLSVNKGSILFKYCASAYTETGISKCIKVINRALLPVLLF